MKWENGKENLESREKQNQRLSQPEGSKVVTKFVQVNNFCKLSLKSTIFYTQNYRRITRTNRFDSRDNNFEFIRPTRFLDR